MSIDKITADTDSPRFMEALKAGNLDTLRSIPKADRHCHALLGADLQKWAQDLKLPAPQLPEYFNDFSEFQVLVDQLFYYGMHERSNKAVRTQIGRLFHATIRAAIEDGVTLLQPSIDASLVKFFDNDHNALIDFVAAIGSEYNQNICIEFELGMARHLEAEQLTSDALPLIQSGFFSSIDFYADERKDGLEAALPLYKEARKKGLRLKAHAGELCDAAYVRKSVEYLDLDEVQHGIAAADDESVMAFLAKRGTILHVCPTSNIMLRRAPSYAAHPVRTLVDNGVQVTINSDDRMVFNSSVSEEYLALYSAGTCSASELDSIRRVGLAGTA